MPEIHELSVKVDTAELKQATAELEAFAAAAEKAKDALARLEALSAKIKQPIVSNIATRVDGATRTGRQIAQQIRRSMTTAA